MRAVAFPAAIALLLGVAALASREPLHGSGSAGGPISVGGSQGVTASPWELALIIAGTAVALVGVIASVGWPPRRRIPEPFRTQTAFKAPLAVQIAVVLFPLLIGAVLVAGALTGSHRRMIVIGGPGLAAPASFRSAPSARLSTSTASSFDVPTWVPIAVLALLIGGAVVLVAKPLARRAVEPHAGPAAVPAVRAAIAVSLEDLATDPDARRAVIAAYRRMEESLAESGLPRRAAEAPREFLARALASLELDPQSLGTLTMLFERAMFSLRRVDLTLRDQAVTALRALREELA